ncbi:MAG: DNA internalization-related competence protein ComEC/Rec2 [Coriobacteriia bacterium]|nr:DNA internalization-related competence protein ComEC/Rec2 [Coriobacteriia bacterium]
MSDPKKDPELDQAARPLLPVLIGPLGAIWASVVIVEHFTWSRYLASNESLPINQLLICAVVVLLFIPMKKYRAYILASVLFFVFSAGVAYQYWHRIDQVMGLLAEADPYGFTCRVVSDPQYGSYSPSSIVEARLSSGVKFRCRIFWPDSTGIPAYGSQLDVHGHFIPLSENNEFLYRQGLAGSFSVTSIDDCHFPNNLVGLISEFRDTNYRLLTEQGEQSAYLLSGVLLGNSGEFNLSWAGEAFKITGLSHLVAVSGSHLVVIATMMAWVLAKLKIKTRVEVFLLLLLVAAYVMLTALQASAVRSAGMMGIVQVARLIGRRSHAPSALSVTASIMLIIQPTTAFSLGFWLSVFSVFGLAVYLPLVREWTELLHSRSSSKYKVTYHPKLVKHARRLISNYIVEPCNISLTAQASTLALSAPAFACISLVSLPANIIVAPLITLILLMGIPGLIIGSFLSSVQHLLVSPLILLGRLSCYLAQQFAGLPFASIPFNGRLDMSLVIALSVAAAVYLLWPHPTAANRRVFWRMLCAVCLVASVIYVKPQAAELVLLDIGQGDAILIREGSISVLIDTGPESTSLRRALARNHVKSLDAVILTHLDNDHCGGLRALTGFIQPDTVYFAAGLISNRSDSNAIQQAYELVGQSRIEELIGGDTLVLSSHLSLSVLLPTHLVYFGDNHDSLVISLNFDSEADGTVDLRMLLTGDAEADDLQKINSLYAGLSFQVLKLAHHGSKGSINNELLRQWECRIVLISVGLNNHYGHPSDQALQTLDDTGALVYRTDELGDISLRLLSQCLVISYSGMRLVWAY